MCLRERERERDCLMNLCFTCLYIKHLRSKLWSLVFLLPLIGATWIVGLVFMVNSKSNSIAWPVVFTIISSLQVSSDYEHNSLLVSHTSNYCSRQKAGLIFWLLMQNTTPECLEKQVLKMNCLIMPLGYLKHTYTTSCYNYSPRVFNF